MSTPSNAPDIDDFYQRLARMLPSSYLTAEVQRRTSGNRRRARSAHGINLVALAEVLEALGEGSFTGGEITADYADYASRDSKLADPTPRAISLALGEIGVPYVKINGLRRFRINPETVEAVRAAAA